MEISAIFPAYNEAENIRPAIAKALETLSELFDRFEILIVDDCGTDGTGQIADELAAEHPEVRVIHNERNIGQGASIVRGFNEARYDLLLHNAMDCSFDMKDLSRMIPLLDRADIVAASRMGRPGYSFYRIIVSLVNRKLIRALFPLKLRDYSFVQLFPRAAWLEVNVEGRSTGFMIPEALIRAFDLGYRIEEIDIPYYPRLAGKATAGKPRVIIYSIYELFRFWWKRFRGRTPRALTRREGKGLGSSTSRSKVAG
ncbi:MAG TPA: glycosyltransferase family 2 protein [Candidatus Binataceae bacterium]|nr:glycosyltransferase family 2 protein [Candidatus Binataceae bacterium]